MAKKPVSVTLEESNLLWLQALAGRGGARNVSDALDRLVTDARQQPGAGGAARSVVSTIDLPEEDPTLEKADAAMRDLFDQSLTRPILVREEVKPMPRTGRRNRK